MPTGGLPPLRLPLSSSALPSSTSSQSALPSSRSPSASNPFPPSHSHQHSAVSPNAYSAPQDDSDTYCSSPTSFVNPSSSSLSNNHAFPYPPHQHSTQSSTAALKSRRDTMASSTSPTSLIARRGTGSANGSPAQSMSMTAGAGGSSAGGGVGSGIGGGAGGGYIGGGFASGPSPLTSLSSSSGSGGSLTNRRRNSLGSTAAQGRRWWTSRGRGTKLVILVLGGLALYWLSGRWRSEEQSRPMLTERWWEKEDTTAEDLAALLPRPSLPPRPPRPKPPPSTPAHTLSQLLKLPSTFSSLVASPSNVDYTALIHLTSSSHLLPSHLSPLLASIARQSPAPARILLLTPQGLEPSSSLLSGLGPVVQVASYPSQQPPIIALVDAAQTKVASDFILFVDGNLPATGSSSGGSEQGMPKDYVRTLLHASGTKEYSAALLTAGGLSLSSSPSSSSSSSSFSSFSSSSGQCLYPSLLSPPTHRTTTLLTLPSLPFLLPSSWLSPSLPSSASSSILNGLNTALPLEVALAGALWTKHAIPVWGIPVSFGGDAAGAGGTVDGWACEKLKRSLEADKSATGLFTKENGGGQGIRRLRASGDRKKGGSPSSAAVGALSPAEAADEARSRLLQSGTVVLLLSGKDELDAARGVACRFAAGVGGKGGGTGEDGEEVPRTELKVVVADYDLVEAEKDESRRRYGSSSSAAAGASTCHLELTPLGAGSAASSTSSSTSEPISLALVDLLDALTPAPAFVLYLSDGPRAREFEEVLRWMGGVFGPRKGGMGERWSRVRAERELLKGVTAGGQEGKAGGGRGRATVVGIKREELRRAEWIGALEVEALRHWHTPRFDLSVVTNDRPVSLHRLITSLQTAHYYGDDVSLAINLEQTSDRLTHRLVDDLRWPHGTYNLRHRILLGTLMPAIVESWYPTSNDTYGVLLEDDVEVSPLFFGWLKFTILQYRYTLAGRRASARLFGVSLYQQKNIELRPEGRQPFDAHRLFDDLNLHPTSPYLSQIPCSWGAAYFPEHWREFHTYLSLRLSELALPISEPLVPAIRSNRWPRSWKKYFIELVYLRGYTMLYPNYPDFESLSTNHLEKGTHVHTSVAEDKKKQLFEVPLLDADASLVDSLPGVTGNERLPKWETLPVLDLWGSLASSDELLERGWQTTRMLGSCGTAAKDLPNLAAPPRYDARELLCRREWSAEQGRLVEAQPLRGRIEVEARAEEDEGRAAAAAAEEEQYDARPRPPARGDGSGEIERVEASRELRDVEERAFYPAQPAQPQAVKNDNDEDEDADNADDEDDARPARPQHDHLHEDASLAESELDDADAGKRNALFDENDGAEGAKTAPRRWRRPVDLEARERLEEESELGLDEDEDVEAEGEQTVGGKEEVEKARPAVRWARAD